MLMRAIVLKSLHHSIQVQHDYIKTAKTEILRFSIDEICCSANVRETFHA